LSSKVRRAAVAGYFYPGDKVKLIETIEWCFKHRLGPGDLPRLFKERKKHVLGYIVPHAGYIYSGPIAAHAFYDMALGGAPESIIILGTNHTGYGKPISVYPSGVWETPLGKLHVDAELARLVVNNSQLADVDTYAHLEEHSIEVQLPFIQYLFGDAVKILPIVMGIHTPEAAKDLAHAVNSAVKGLNRDVIVLSSSDFSHYEPHDVAVRKDMLAIDNITKLDVEGFYRAIVEENISVCGPGGIMTLIELAKLNGAKGVLLKYATSGDVWGDKSAVVGYASIKFYLL